MFVTPNLTEKCASTTIKNDLYRKFKDYFIGITEKEFHKFDHYGKKGYISVNPIIEQRVIDTLAHNINEILPITGATGIGKTYLLLYCLKCYYDVEDIPTNHPCLFKKNDTYDLVYYSDFNITEQSILEDPQELCKAKLKAMQDCIMDNFNVSIPGVDYYIHNHKSEVKYYSDDNIGYQKELYRLSLMLKNDNLPIKNVIYIFDDLESLTEKQQFILIENFLTLFENLKSQIHNKCNFKFIFCLRNKTYYNIYRQDFYNTHRASKAAHLSVAPPLSEIFSIRFNIVFDTNNSSPINNETTWKEAKDILLSISERIDNSYTNLLLKLNNNNICNALDDFLKILSNRRWTQKNANPSASFKIDRNDYYINDTNILRILSMGERNIFYKSVDYPVRCILPNPGISFDADYISYLVLRAFRNNNYADLEDVSNNLNLYSVEHLVDCISDLIGLDQNKRDERTRIEKIIREAFTYYEDNRFIHKNDNPTSTSGTTKYYMLPRGEEIFDLFFSQTILFNIFRDSFMWNSECYNILCSYQLSFGEIIKEAIKYEKQLIKTERRFFEKIARSNMWITYISLFGAWSVSESFLNGIKTSVKQFYKIDDDIANEINNQLVEIETDVSQLTGVFKTQFEGNTLF